MRGICCCSPVLQTTIKGACCEVWPLAGLGSLVGWLMAPWGLRKLFLDVGPGPSAFGQLSISPLHSHLWAWKPAHSWPKPTFFWVQAGMPNDLSPLPRGRVRTMNNPPLLLFLANTLEGSGPLFLPNSLFSNQKILDRDLGETRCCAAVGKERRKNAMRGDHVSSNRP